MPSGLLCAFRLISVISLIHLLKSYLSTSHLIVLVVIKDHCLSVLFHSSFVFYLYFESLTFSDS